MKELTIEQKAQRYDEAIEGIQEILSSGEDYIKMSRLQLRLQGLFPELKESEDERMRKKLIRAFKSLNTIKVWNGIERTEILAWLDEKQGMSYTKRDVDDAYLEGVTNTKNEIEKQYEASYQIRKDIATFILNYRGDIKDRAKWMDYLGIKVSFVEKQGEQKPADKVKPKFHEGDWTVSNLDGKARQISEIRFDEYNCYYVVDGKSVNLEEYDRLHHLWTIQDAKDGDVLAFKNNICGIIICKSPTDYDTRSYCRLACDNLINKEESGLDSTLLVPATKEQRDTLMKAMADAGWEFNFEKKELKKIEQTSDKWSEEDEDMLYKTISVINRLCAEGKEYVWSINTLKKLFYWLKSLKNKYTWKPSDGQMDSITCAVRQMKESACYDSELVSLYQDLKKLKEE